MKAAIAAGVVAYCAVVAFTLLLLSANKTPQPGHGSHVASIPTDGENSPHNDQP